ncbi:unnamed protein product [Peronospora destructor]|uniref:RING-type domain-containing protein n=1 Tax=Peronospora destructor TaxID=86335 RepID=A0AAV0SWZ7_9STRA|nr:unnamed protein product [Peronospora destructor]
MVGVNRPQAVSFVPIPVYATSTRATIPYFSSTRSHRITLPVQVRASHSHSGPNSNQKNNRTFVGKRSRDYSTKKAQENEGIDLFEAEIARACTALRKQEADLPPSYLECSVCLSSNAVAEISACGHTFHPHCFLRWFRLNRSCPLCRGPVDKIQLAQSLTVQNELEAIMAELEDESMPLVGERSPALDLMELEDSSLLPSSDQLMSFLEADFKTDMELMALDDLSNDGDTTSGALELILKQEAADGEENKNIEMEELVDTGYKQEVLAMNTPSYMEFTPRMVHIAPKRDVQQSPPMWTTEETFKMPVPHVSQQIHNHPVHASTPAAPRVVSCRCTGGCRNGRCVCVKEGGMCDASCRCTSCKNPFSMAKAAGADIDALLKDDCFMHNVLKTRDMVQRLQEPVAVPCCEGTIKVVDCVQGYTCEPCKRRYDFSWCMNKLLASERTPRNHCAICKRCCDHRDVHCHNCGRCYFAGVVASLPCPCKEALSHKKRCEAAAKDKSEEVEEEAEGECCIM